MAENFWLYSVRGASLLSRYLFRPLLGGKKKKKTFSFLYSHLETSVSLDLWLLFQKGVTRGDLVLFQPLVLLEKLEKAVIFASQQKNPPALKLPGSEGNMDVMGLESALCAGLS